MPSSSLRRSLQHSTVTGQEQKNFILFLRLKSSIHFLSMVYSEYLLLKCNNVAVPKVHWIYLAVIPSKSGQFGEKLQLSQVPSLCSSDISHIFLRLCSLNPSQWCFLLSLLWEVQILPEHILGRILSAEHLDTNGIWLPTATLEKFCVCLSLSV